MNFNKSTSGLIYVKNQAIEWEQRGTQLYMRHRATRMRFSFTGAVVIDGTFAMSAIRKEGESYLKSLRKGGFEDGPNDIEEEVDQKKLAAKPAALILVIIPSVPLEETLGFKIAMTFKPFIDPKCSEHMEIVKDMARSINRHIKPQIGRFAIVGKTATGEKYWNELSGQFESEPKNLNDYTFTGRDIFRVAKKVKTIFENIESEIVFL